MLDDGTFIMDTYGHWDKEFSQNWPGGVTTDRCYIKQAKFKLGEVEYANGLIDRSGLKAAIKRAEALNAADYTADSWAKMDAAVEAAKAGDADESLQQAQVDALVAAIDAAIDGLKAKDDGDKPGPGDGGKPGAGDGKPGDGKPGKGDETKPDTGKKGGLSATGAGIVPIAAAALTLMAGAALALAKR